MMRSNAGDSSRQSRTLRKLIEDLLIQRMADNDKVVTRYMDDADFQNVAFPILAKEIFDAVRARESGPGTVP